MAVMGAIHIPRPPWEPVPAVPPSASRWVPFRYGGYAWPPSLPGQRLKKGDMYFRYVSPFLVFGKEGLSPERAVPLP